jgi:hypothetical protein
MGAPDLDPAGALPDGHTSGSREGRAQRGARPKSTTCRKRSAARHEDHRHRAGQEDLGANNAYVLGRVSAGSCDTDDFSGAGVAGVRVYLEDGTYSITDANGYYHFAGIRKGAHVVQMDVQSLPGFYEPLPCANDEGHAFAGRPFSQFVDMQGGALWRSDFRVQMRPRRQGGISQRLESQLVGDTIHHQLALRGNGVDVRNARAVVSPEGGVRVSA